MAIKEALIKFYENLKPSLPQSEDLIASLKRNNTRIEEGKIGQIQIFENVDIHLSTHIVLINEHNMRIFSQLVNELNELGYKPTHPSPSKSDRSSS